MLLPYYFSFSMQSAMVVAWAHQDYLRPIDLSKQRAAKIKQLKEQLTKSKKKLSVREEELKNNAIDLVARSEELEKARLRLAYLRENWPGFIRKEGH